MTSPRPIPFTRLLRTLSDAELATWQREAHPGGTFCAPIAAEVARRVRVAQRRARVAPEHQPAVQEAPDAQLR